MTASSSAHYGYFVVDLQHHYVNRALRQGGHREVFEGLTERCLAVEAELHNLHIPSAHIFTFQDTYRACGTAGQKIYYDTQELKVYKSAADLQAHPNARAIHLDAVYNVTDQDVIFKYDHHAYGSASQGCMSRFVERNHVEHSIFSGAFADNCIWKCAQVSLSDEVAPETAETTVLLDCIAACNSPVRLDDMIQQNYEFFTGLEKRYAGRLHLTTSDQFIQSLKNGHSANRLAA